MLDLISFKYLSHYKRLKISSLINIKQHAKITRRAKKWLFLDVLGMVAGVAGGLGAIIFRLMIDINHFIFFNFLLPNINLFGLNWGILILPALGGLLMGPIIMKFAPETKGHGVPEVMEAVALKGGKIRKRVAIFKIIVSSVTIGSGGSAGREGPIAQIGASIGSLCGEIFKLDPHDVRLLVVCGLSAGIAGTFNAPLGGMLFGLEVLYREIGLFYAIPVALASVVGAAIVSTYYGPKPSFIAPSSLTFTNPSELILYFILGFIFGILSVLWVKLFYKIEDLFNIIRLHDRYKLALGGVVTGLIGVFYPEHGILGVGYEGINLALAGEISLMVLFILGILKMVATAFTIGSGGSGGIFAPSLYIGTMFGGVLGLLFDSIFPELVNEPFTYSLAGMAALFAGAAQAPITVMIMIPEMSRDYSLFPPLMISSATSFIISYLFLKGSSIYTLKLERRGIKFKIGKAILEYIKVEEVMTKKVISVRKDIPLSALELLVEESGHHNFPVIEKGKLIGMVTYDELLKIPPRERSKIKIEDILNKEIHIAYKDESVQSALDKMYRYKISALPIVDENDPDHLVGILTHSDVLRAYEIAITSSLE